MENAEDNAIVDQGPFNQSEETRNITKNITATAVADTESRPMHDFSRVEDTGDVQEPNMILHGDPITISRCIFQAHIALINSPREAEAVSKRVSAEIARQAGCAPFVCPFAYRLTKNAREKHVIQKENKMYMSDDQEPRIEEQVDDGDAGSGDKLLYLLQRRGVWDAVLAVTRINGGFAMAEILGIRRYRFVLDRAKRLLDSNEWASLRRPTGARENTSRVPAFFSLERALEASGNVSGDENLMQDCASKAPAPGSRRASRGDDGEMNGLGGASRSRGGTAPSLKVRYSPESPGRKRVTGSTSEIPVKECLRRRAQGRRTLSLGKLSISSKTVEFPPGHVPSVLGTRGHGYKRGRINHFAERTPRRDSSEIGGLGVFPEHDRALPRATPQSVTPEPRTTSIGEDNPRHRNSCTEFTSTVSGRGSLAGRRGLTQGCDHEGNDKTPGSCEDVYSQGAFTSGASSNVTIDSLTQIKAVMERVCTGLSQDHAICPPSPRHDQDASIQGEHPGFPAQNRAVSPSSTRSNITSFPCIRHATSSLEGGGGQAKLALETPGP